MIKGRNLSSFTDKQEAIAALEAILVLFGKDYLEIKKTHRLPQLWSRPDHLASIELLTLGICIKKIAPTHEKWLKDTARKIKREAPERSHGYFTEILFLGIFSLNLSKIIPAPSKNPGCDFYFELPNKTKHFISVKNIDASDSHKKFQEHCRKIRSKWREILRTNRVNLSLSIISTKNITKNNFEKILEEIDTLKNLEKTNTITVDGNEISIFIKNINNEIISPKYVSDTVLIYCPSPESEKIRYNKKIRDAINNIATHIPSGDNTTRVIFMRMHVNADYKYITEQVKNFIAEECDKIDCIICYQPSYSRDDKNNSVLHHCLKFEASDAYGLKMAGSDYLKIEVPLGSISTEQSIVRIKILPGNNYIDVSASDYFFQQGDIYHTKGISPINSLGSPATGIRNHAVFKVEEKYITISSKMIPEIDNLIIV